MKKIRNELWARITEMTSKLDDLRGELEGEADEAESYYDERSEKWQEGEKGEAYSTWKHLLRDTASAAGEMVDTLNKLTQEPEG